MKIKEELIMFTTFKNCICNNIGYIIGCVIGAIIGNVIYEILSYAIKYIFR